MTTMTTGSRVWCAGSSAVGTIEELKGALATVKLDSGKSVIEFTDKLELLPTLEVGYKVQTKGKSIMGTVTKVVNNLFVEVTYDRAIKPVIQSLRHLEFVSRPIVVSVQKMETTTERGKRRLEKRAERAAKVLREAEEKRAKDKATKEAKIAAQAISKKDRKEKKK